ncbi:unnamed protein product, partial [Musa textilis]
GISSYTSFLHSIRALCLEQAPHRSPPPACFICFHWQKLSLLPRVKASPLLPSIYSRSL